VDEDPKPTVLVVGSSLCWKVTAGREISEQELLRLFRFFREESDGERGEDDQAEDSGGERRGTLISPNLEARPTTLADDMPIRNAYLRLCDSVAGCTQRVVSRCAGRCMMHAGESM
jgi:hypothetical protein